MYRLDFGMTFIYSCHDLACLCQILLYLEARSRYKPVPDDLAINIFHTFAIRCSTLNMNSNNEVFKFFGRFLFFQKHKNS